jgi:hypothetical protein
VYWFMVSLNASTAIEYTDKIKRRANITIEFLDVFSYFFSQSPSNYTSRSSYDFLDCSVNPL